MFRIGSRGIVLAVSGLVAVTSIVMMGVSDDIRTQSDGKLITTSKRSPVSLNEISAAVGVLREGYAYAERMSPRVMFVSALKGVQDSIPSVLVSEFPVGSRQNVEKVTLRVGHEEKEYDLSELNDLYEMNWKLMDAATFLANETSEKLNDIEEWLLEGLLAPLDPHTSYLDALALQEITMSTTGKFGGLGIVISVRGGELKVMSVMEDTPASEAGLQEGDHVVQINDESTVNMLVSEAASRMRGKPGTVVTIWIKREGWTEPEKRIIERRIIRMKSAEGEKLSDGTLAIWIRNFQKGTTGEVEKILRDHPDTKRLVLDLRGNSGGLMYQAVSLADLFMDGGVVVRARYREGIEDEVNRAKQGEDWEALPIIVLVDSGTASASEILAGALKFSNRATIVGSQTFGKGSVQFLRELERGAIKMTVAQYLVPGEISIPGRGEAPHLTLVPVRVGETDIRQGMLQHSSGSSHYEHYLSAPLTLHDRTPLVIASDYSS